MQNQVFKDFEVIIIDQTENPVSLDFFKNLNIKYFRSDELSASVARNIGIRRSKSEVVLFLDDDVIISNRHFVGNHLRHYTNPNVVGVAGCIMEPDGIKKSARHRWSYKKDVGWLFFPRNYAFPAKVQTGGSGNLSVRRVLAIQYGGMDENYQKGAHREESDFCLRITKNLCLLEYDPDADLIHIGSPQGGIRSWNSTSSILKKQQHYDGAFYFMIKNFRLREFPYHLAVTLVFFFYDKKLIQKPYLLFVSFYRMLLGIIYGFKRFRKPRYLTL